MTWILTSDWLQAGSAEEEGQQGGEPQEAHPRGVQHRHQECDKLGLNWFFLLQFFGHFLTSKMQEYVSTPDWQINGLKSSVQCMA